MSMIVYLNGDWRPLAEACISVQDRGFMFGDGVYEVIRYYNGRSVAMDDHVQRMHRSMEAIDIRFPGDAPDFASLSDQLMERNGLTDAAMYWQVTRGVAPRKHPFPDPPVSPTVLIMAYPADPFEHDAPTPQLKAIIRPDIRWEMCWIKATTLLANVLDTQAAAQAGCQEAVLVRNDIVTEGTARSIYIAKGKTLYTHPRDGRILDSITRRIFNQLGPEAGYDVREEYFKQDQLFEADEIIAVGTTTEVAAIVELEGKPIGDGTAGPIATDMFRRFRNWVARECGIS